jgi:hypothetical protein
LGGFPNKILPGGYVLGTTGTRGGKYSYQDQLNLVQVDWDGNIVWKFDKTELVADPEKKNMTGSSGGDDEEERVDFCVASVKKKDLK